MPTTRRLLGASLRCHVKGSDSEPSELGPKHVKYIHDAIIHLKGVPLCFFVGKQRHWRSPNEGSEKPARQCSHVDTTKGQKPEATHYRSGEGFHVDIQTWQCPIEALKSSLIL
jgi:hypothetical protein